MADSGSNSGPPIRAGLEVSNTAFKTAELLWTLIAKTSQDDVHPSSVLGAELLGNQFHVVRERISAAQEVLNINRSYGFQDTMIWLGLVRGETLRLTQQSLGLKSFFVTYAGLKIFYDDETIASLCHEMLLHSSLYATYQITTAQFEKLIRQMTGHANKLLPLELRSIIEHKLVAFRLSNSVYDVLQTQRLSELLTRFWESYRKDPKDVPHIDIIGHAGGIVLATCILWWLEGSALLQVNNDVIHGPIDARVRVKLVLEANQPWSIAEWASTEHPARMIHKCELHDSTMPVRRLPLANMAYQLERSFLNWTAQDMTGYQANRQFWIKHTTQIAVSLVWILYQRGKFSTHVVLKDIVNEHWSDRFDSILVKYGFDKTNIDDALIQDLERAIRECQLMCGEMRYHSRNEIEKPFYRTIEKYIHHAKGDGNFPCEVFDSACILAFDAVITSIVKVEETAPRFTELQAFLSHDDALWFLLKLILDERMAMNEFRFQSMQILLLEHERLPDQVLVHSRNGYVAAMSMLIKPSVNPREAFAIQYLEGGIIQNHTIYSTIQETAQDFPLCWSWYHNPVADGFKVIKKACEGVTLTSPLSVMKFTFDTQTTTTRDIIHLKQYIVTKDSHDCGKNRFNVSWLGSIEGCAAAGYQYKQATPQQHAMLAHNPPSFTNVRWGYAEIPVEYESGAPNGPLIIDTRGNMMLTIFGIGLHYLYSGHHKKIFVYHEGSLLPLLKRASKHDSWILFI